MQIASTVHLLSRDEDAFREVLDNVDAQLLSYGVAPDNRVVTQYSLETIHEYAELNPNAEEDPMGAVSEELLELVEIEDEDENENENEDGDPDVSYARLTGMRILDRLVREETAGHQQVALQVDKHEADMLTEYAVYQFDSGEDKYDQYAVAEGLFEV